MFSKDEKSFRSEANTSKDQPTNQTTLPSQNKKRLQKEPATREIDKDYALRLIRDHMSQQESQKA